MRVGESDGFLPGQDWFKLVLALAHSAHDFMFCCDCFRCGKQPAGLMDTSFDADKFTVVMTPLQIGTDLGIAQFAHSAAKGIPHQ